MGIADWILDSQAVQEKLAKAYGPRSSEGAAVTRRDDITYKSSGVVLKIEPDRKAALQKKLDEVSKALSFDISKSVI
jgi:hypothetical protein